MVISERQDSVGYSSQDAVPLEHIARHKLEVVETETAREAELAAFGGPTLLVTNNGCTQYLFADNSVGTSPKYRLTVEFITTDGRHGYIPVKSRIGVGEIEPGFIGDLNIRIRRVRWLWKYRDAFFALFDKSDWAEASAGSYIEHALLHWFGQSGWTAPIIWEQPIR